MNIPNRAKCRLVNYLFYFLIYSFLGWCVEVSYKSISNGQLTNRGFLLGPFCCIYGIGLLLIIVFLWPVKHNPLLLFIGSAVLSSLLEYTTGYLLEMIFHTTWWDYSNEPFNLAGRVCLSYSLIWGAISLAVIQIIHPCIRNAVKSIASRIKITISFVLVWYFITDFAISCIIALENKNKIPHLSNIASLISTFLENIRDFITNLL